MKEKHVEALSKPWAKNTVDRYLSDLWNWIRHGYRFTEKQRARFTRLAELLEEKGEKE